VERAAALKPTKVYDAVFLKRVQAVKGALDLPKIWKHVVATNPKAKLLVIGFGEDFDRLKEMVKQEGLESNIELAGLVYDLQKKFSLLCSSKLFILPSYEENWAIVIGEAMGAGLPVVAYGLDELKVVWKDNFVPVPVGDTEAFSKNILQLLNNEYARQSLAAKAKDYVARLDWSRIAERELQAILPAYNSNGKSH
jgi:glycosyltransferase involved in cell wall biosynthesis